MPVESDEQAQFIKDVELLRDSIRGATTSIKTQSEGNARNALLQLQRINECLADAKYSDAYGDGSAGTVAEAVAAEVAAINAAIDAVVDASGKTRAEIEAEITPPPQ